MAYELGLRLGKEVGFQVRHDRRIGDSCSIKFMTDGILLRELQVRSLFYGIYYPFLIYLVKRISVSLWMSELFLMLITHAIHATFMIY